MFPGSFLCLRRGLVSEVAAIVPTLRGPRTPWEGALWGLQIWCPRCHRQECVAVVPDFTGFPSKRCLDRGAPEYKNNWRNPSFLTPLSLCVPLPCLAVKQEGASLSPSYVPSWHHRAWEPAAGSLLKAWSQKCGKTEGAH